MSDKAMVLAIFGSEASADRAVVVLKGSALVPGDAISVLVLGLNGELKVDKAGFRSIGKGAGIGAVLFLLGPAVAGIGVLGGSLLVTLHHKGLGLGENDRDRIVAELRGGKAAVGVLAPAGSLAWFRRGWPIWAACPRPTPCPTRRCSKPARRPDAADRERT